VPGVGSSPQCTSLTVTSLGSRLNGSTANTAFRSRGFLDFVPHSQASAYLSSTGNYQSARKLIAAGLSGVSGWDIAAIFAALLCGPCDWSRHIFPRLKHLIYLIGAGRGFFSPLLPHRLGRCI
jgi:hypothetical protein